MAQMQVRVAPKTITVYGVTYTLRKDATSYDPSFPCDRMVWVNAGCDEVDGAYCCWVAGIIPPIAGVIPQPVSVLAIAFSSHKMTMHPAMFTPADMQQMHYYIADAAPMVQTFVRKFLGKDPDDGAVSKFSPYPEALNGRGNTGSAEKSVGVAGSVEGERASSIQSPATTGYAYVSDAKDN